MNGDDRMTATETAMASRSRRLGTRTVVPQLSSGTVKGDVKVDVPELSWAKEGDEQDALLSPHLVAAAAATAATESTWPRVSRPPVRESRSRSP